MPAEIPQGLDRELIDVYHILHQVRDTREKDNIETQAVFVISDIAKDYDDLVAWIILKELHRLKIIELKGFITNLILTDERARYGRGVLDLLGLHDIPVGKGEDAVDESARKQFEQHSHEFEDATFMAPKTTPFENGHQLLKEVLTDAEKHGYKVRLLLLSSLTDIAKFSHDFPNLVKKQVSDLYMQGGYDVGLDEKPTPLTNTANNDFDFESAKRFHEFIGDNKVQSTVYTKVAALVAKIPIFDDFFQKHLKNTGHILGERLALVQQMQEVAFYKKACNEDPSLRFTPFMDQGWYLDNKSTWWTAKKYGIPVNKNPKRDTQGRPIRGTGKWPATVEDVIPFFNLVIVYDALPAIGAAGNDANKALGVLALSPTKLDAVHRVVGQAATQAIKEKDEAGHETNVIAVPAKPLDIGIDPKRMAIVIKALVLGGLLASQQNLPMPKFKKSEAQEKPKDHKRQTRLRFQLRL
jgi:hypothetical protein